MSEQPRLRDDIALVDALTDFLYDECGMGGASTYHTKRVLDFVEDWRPATSPPRSRTAPSGRSTTR